MAHACHAIGCSARVAPRFLMCRRHWFTVPREIRDEVWEHYRPGQERAKRFTRAWHLAATRAINAVAVAEGRMTPQEAAAREERIRENKILDYEDEAQEPGEE